MCERELLVMVDEFNDPNARRYKIAMRLPPNFDQLWRQLRLAACHPKLANATDAFAGATQLGSSSKIQQVKRILEHIRRTEPDAPPKLIVFSSLKPLLCQTKTVLEHDFGWQGAFAPRF